MKFLLISLLITILAFVPLKPAMSAQSLENRVNKLEKKISQKFSKTYCNASGFGISDQGALNFALGETKVEFSKNPLIENVDINSIKEQILIDIPNTCNYFQFSKSNLDELSLSQ